MKKPAFKTFEKNLDSLVLIVDKIGVIGERLALEFSKDYFVVFVTRRPLSVKSDKISQVLFKGKIPKVPRNLYSKTFIVDDGDTVTRESAMSFLKKAKETNSLFFFLGSIRNIDVEKTGEIVRYYEKAKILIFGDLFDKEILFDRNSSITKFILGVKNDHEILVPSDGLALNYPITLEDTVKLIIKASFLEIPQKTILLFYKDPITDISLAHVFQKIEPNINVDFTTTKNKQKIYLPENNSYALSKYNIKEKLEELGLDKSEVRIVLDKESRKLNFKYFKMAGFIFLCFLFLFLLPLITTEGYLFLGSYQIKESVAYSKKGEFEKALSKANQAFSFFSIAQNTNQPLDSQLRLIGAESFSEKISTKIEAGENLSQIENAIISGEIMLEKVYLGQSNDPEKDIKLGTDSIKNAYLIIQKTKLQEHIPTDVETEINNILPVVEIFSNQSEVIPDIFGIGGEKTYLILFQNNLIIRPSGGVIGLIGVLNFKNGKVTDFKLIKSRELDSNLKTHVEPPFALRRYLPTTNFYLKDSGFDSDFIKDSITAASIYKLETGEKVDGVIGVNLEFIKALLKETGRVNVLSYGVKVNADNLYQTLREQKGEDFIFALVNTIRQGLSKNTNASYIALIRAIGDSIQSKDILFAFVNPGTQKNFNANELSGSLEDNRSKESGQLNDYFGLSEANLSNTEISYFISRSISKEVTIGEDGKFSSVATIAFKNNEQNKENYNVYLQLILPDGSKIQDISVGGKKFDIIPATTDHLVYEKNGFLGPKGLEVEQSTENNKSVFGFFVSVSPSSVKTIKVAYSLPLELSEEKTTKYSLNIYKQPGVDPYPFDLTFKRQNNVSILPADFYSGEIDTDKQVNFTIIKK